MNIIFVARICDSSFHLITYFHSGIESFQTGFCIVAPTIIMIDVLLCNEKDVIEKEKVFFLVPVTKNQSSRKRLIPKSPQ